MGHDDLLARIAALEDELGRLKAEASSRREMFKKLALTGAVRWRGGGDGGAG